MEDKEFRGYFDKLMPPSSLPEIKSASEKIVATLQAIGTIQGRKSSVDSTTNK